MFAFCSHFTLVCRDFYYVLTTFPEFPRIPPSPLAVGLQGVGHQLMVCERSKDVVTVDANLYSQRQALVVHARLGIIWKNHTEQDGSDGMWCVGRTVKVPYAKKWRKETDKLREIVLGCDLTEELKWGKPCFTYQKKNVAIIGPLKDACALSFFKGALLKDPKHILQRIGQAQAGRWIKFTSLKEITGLQPTLRNYIHEAIQIEESGKKVPLKKASEYVVPEELQVRLNAVPELKAAFEALTPGRRKSYIFHVSGAKQAKTRAARAERCIPIILSGRGFNEFRD